MDNQQVQLDPQELQALKEGRQLQELTALPGWGLLRQWLEDRIHNSWLDPRSFKTEEEFIKAYNEAWSMAQAAEQVLGYVQNKCDEAEHLIKKERGELVDKLREAIS